MPFIYVRANASIEIILPSSGFMSDWDDLDALRVCEEYGHPRCTINFQIDDPEEPLRPMLIFVSDREAYEGGIEAEKIDGKTYRFSVDGLFKSSVHKDTLKSIKARVKPRFIGVTRYRQAFDVPEESIRDLDLGEWLFSDKKL